eukprot:4378585-Prymnesium_polylepis.1
MQDDTRHASGVPARLPQRCARVARARGHAGAFGGQLAHGRRGTAYRRDELTLLCRLCRSGADLWQSGGADLTAEWML